VAPVVLLLLQTRWYVMNEEKTGTYPWSSATQIICRCQPNHTFNIINRWNRTMLNLCGIVASILKMAAGRNCSMSGINSGHYYLPTYQILMISNNVEFLPPHTMNYKTKHVKLNIWGESRYSGRISSSCSTSGTRRFTFVANPVICHEWGKDWNISVCTCMFSKN
jgi:hypothetical protein